jgi:hypothetical protein|tara:strand:+ start:599 stop:826 length:228 start_codon:yes stop_codon:yes gene_type:complete
MTIPPVVIEEMEMATVVCIKSVSIGSLNRAFLEGETYDIPSKEANAYTEYFKKKATTTKKKTTGTNKQTTTQENK